MRRAASIDGPGLLQGPEERIQASLWWHGNRRHTQPLFDSRLVRVACRREGFKILLGSAFFALDENLC